MSFKPFPFSRHGSGDPLLPVSTSIPAESAPNSALHSPAHPLRGTEEAVDVTAQGVQFTDKGIEVADGADLRVTLGDLGGGSFGLMVISSDGSTVIIDGTSDMFRILATGTQSVATNNGDRNIESSTTLAGLGAFAATPAQMTQVGSSNASTGYRWVGLMAEGVVDGNMWVAPSSGAAATNLVIFHGVNAWTADCRVGLDGSNHATVILHSSNQSGATHTAYSRYYLLAQTAI